MMTETATPVESTDHAGRRLTWKVFGVLMLGALIGSVAIIPYSLALSPKALEGLSIPIPLALVISVLQTMILVAVVAGLGLWLSPRVGLGAPRLRQWLAGDRESALQRLKPAAVRAAVAGAVTSLVVILLDVFAFPGTLQAQSAGSAGNPSYWQGLLSSLYGGINEELLIRLGVMTIIVWLGAVLLRRQTPPDGLYWFGIVISAVAFGLGHLPATGQSFNVTALVVLRAVVLNGLGGVVLGWFYWRHGLLSAMAGHFSADLVLHVLVPLLGG
jgi:hypothetical protein